MKLRYLQYGLATLYIVLFFGNVATYGCATGISWLHKPIYYIYGGIALSLPLFISANRIRFYFSSPVWAWCAFYIAISTISYLTIAKGPVAYQELENRVRSVLLLTIAIFIFSSEKVQMFSLKLIFAITVVGVIMNFYEVFYPGTYSIVKYRSAGFYVNPTVSAIGICIGMIITMQLVTDKWRYLYALSCGLGILFTFSRGGIIEWIVTILLMFREKILRLSKATCVIFMLYILAYFAGEIILPKFMQQTEVFEDDNVRTRLQWFSDVKGTKDQSSVGRIEFIKTGLRLFADNLLTGQGLASGLKVEGAGLHNMYLSLMADHGLIGIFIFPLFIYSVVKRAYGNDKKMAWLFAIFLMMDGVFSHNVLENYQELLASALVAAITLSGRIKSITARQLRA